MKAILTVAGAIFALTPSALAATQQRASNTKTFKLAQHTEKQYVVGYPYALKYANATYACQVRKLPPASVPPGQRRPELGKVKVIAKGPSQGGSVCLVTVQNKNGFGTAAVRIRITTTTTWTA